MKNLLIALACLSFVACSHDDAVRILEAEGYENVEITNFGWLRCRDNATEKTSFKAERDGEEIDGSMCLPYLYRYTVTRIRRGEEVLDDTIYDEAVLDGERVGAQAVELDDEQMGAEMTEFGDENGEKFSPSDE